MPPVIDRKACNLCGVCEDVCPGDVLHISAGKARMVRYSEECQHCDVCRIECPKDAIKIVFPWYMLQTSLRNPVKLVANVEDKV